MLLFSVVSSRVVAYSHPRRARVLGCMAKEAVAFAVLGFLTWNGLPGSVTAATGAAHPAILGTIQPGAAPLRLPEPAGTPPRYLRLR
jgi:anhydro-N-acetylmuramic acid kinase